MIVNETVLCKLHKFQWLENIRLLILGWSVSYIFAFKAKLLRFYSIKSKKSKEIFNDTKDTNSSRPHHSHVQDASIHHDLFWK